MLCLALFTALPIERAEAYDFKWPRSVVTDPSTGGFLVCPGPGLARRIVPCIKETVLFAVNTYLIPFTAHLGDIIAGCCTLAIVIWGVTLAMGKQSAPVRDMLTLAIKVGAVILYTANINIWFPLVLDSMDSLMGIVTGYVNVSSVLDCPLNNDPPTLAIWDTVDCMINGLTGNILSNYTLKSGILGFLTACIFSTSPIGLFIALVGFVLIIMILLVIFRAISIYVGCYIGIAMLMVISIFPVLTIPFPPLKGYFDKWFRLVLHYGVVQLCSLFLFLAMLEAGFETVVYTGPYSLVHAIAGNAPGTPYNPDFDIGDWLDQGAYGDKSILGEAVGIDPGAVARDQKLSQTGGVAEDAGAMGVLPEQLGAVAQDWATDLNNNGIYDFLGIGDANDLRFFRADLHVDGVDWDWLANKAGAPDTQTYLTNLCISALLAAITAYVYLLLLGHMPGIGGGVGEKPIGLPTLGGNNFASKLQGAIIKGASGGSA